MHEKESNFQPPDLEMLQKYAEPLRRYFDPQYFGLENVSLDQPALYVANHTTYGILDAPLYGIKLYEEKGIFLRALGDHFHYKLPGWRDFMSNVGIVRGTRENCNELMQNGQHILVFPGGAREVFKKKGEENKLIWKQRTGFVRMAIENGYPIIPLASVGADQAYSIVSDSDDFQSSLLGQLLERAGIFGKHLKADYIPPFVKGVGWSILPRPERFYFKFGEAIPTMDFAGRADDEDLRVQIKDQVAGVINVQMEELMQLREKDKAKEKKGWRKYLSE